MSPKFYGQPTTCSGEPGHIHTLPLDAPHIAPDVTMSAAKYPVQVDSAPDGRRLRWVGAVTFEETTGRMHINPRLGATAVEVQALIATAASPRDSYKPTEWPTHPCISGARRISLMRYVEDGYAAEAAAEVVIDLHDDAFASVLTSWSEQAQGASVAAGETA